MDDGVAKIVFDNLRKGRHISIGHDLWEPILTNKTELVDLFDRIGFELIVRSDQGYAFFKAGDDEDLADKKVIQRAVAVLNLLILDLKDKISSSDLERFIEGSKSLPLEDIKLHNIARFSSALKQLKLKDDEAVVAVFRNTQRFGFHTIEEERVRLLRASHRIFEHSMNLESAILGQSEEE